MKKAYLVLENGKIFEGKSIGADGITIGELVFTTSVVGYLETLTDPAYSGQIIMQTFPLIGNYGVIEEDFEGSCYAAGYVVRECCDVPSNFRSQNDLDSYLKKAGIVGICDVDTREITKIIRENGTMTAKICTDLKDVDCAAMSSAIPSMSSKSKEVFSADGASLFRIAIIDYGVKKSNITALTERGCEVTVFPSSVSADEIISFSPDGILLSSGPGNPEENTFCIEQIKSLIGKFPIFGIGLGHQLTALAMGGKTDKLKYGHRGSNQPVKELSTGKMLITNQNHGYIVTGDIPGTEVTYLNANDSTIEGLEYHGKNCFTIQFDATSHLFDKFISMIKAVKDNA